MAAIGVKFGQCGSNLIKAAERITEKTIINLGLIDLYFMKILSLGCHKSNKSFGKKSIVLKNTS